jgi:hypothetical protein
MDLCFIHEEYKVLYLEDIEGYPNKFLINQFDVFPIFYGNPVSTVAHIFEFTKCIYYENLLHEDVCQRLFFLSLGSEQRDWINHSCNPRSTSSLTILIREFLKCWGPKAQSLEDTIQDLEDDFFERRF